MTKFYCLDELQGKTEQRSEVYREYGERVAQVLTQQVAKNNQSMAGFACHKLVVTGGF